MKNLEEFKDHNRLNELKKIQIKKAQTMMFNDIINEDQKEVKLIKKDCWNGFLKNTRKILLSHIFSFLATFAIIIILFVDDVRIIAINKDYDIYVDAVMLIIIIFIFFEITAFIIFIKGYRFSFFFWLDICSFCSLIPDMFRLFVDDNNLDYYSVGDQSG